MPQPSPFAPAFFQFFRELRRNNRKEWFEANRDRYEEDVLEPSKAFVLAFRPHLRDISAHFRAEPRVRGGSLFRIHANLRFRPGGDPYKEHAGIQFRHAGGDDVHAPGFYLHLEPTRDAAEASGDDEPASLRGGCFVGMGLWHPDRDTLTAIRQAIVDDPDGWTSVVRDDGFTGTFELGGESLVRGPVGFDHDHPLIDDIKRKDFIAAAPLSEDEVTGRGFVESFAERCRVGAPFVRWLCGAVGADF